MNGTTNPYRTWLGLDVDIRPDCYTLLGLPAYENDRGKIIVAVQAAQSRAAIPMSPADEPFRQSLLAEIQAAEACLLDPQQKQAYDAQLQAYYAGQQTPVQSTVATMAAPATSPITSVAPANPAAPTVKGSASAVGAAKSRAQRSSSGFYGAAIALLLVAAVGGGAFYYLAYLPALEQERVAKQSESPSELSNQIADNKPTNKTEPVPEEKKPENSATPNGKRPTAGELANSIPGLGDPNDAMNNLPAANGMNRPAASMATEQQQQALDAAIETAWRAVSNQSLDQAAAALEGVRGLPKTPEGEATFARTDRLIGDLLTFQRALTGGLASLEENETLQVGSTQFTVTTINNDRIVIRVAGQNKAYEKGQLPEGLKRAIAISRIEGNDTEAKRIEASFLLLSKLADADYIRNLWMQSGAPADDLAALESAREKYVSTQASASTTMQANTSVAPSEMTDIQKADQLASRLKQAKTFLAQRKVAQAGAALQNADQLVAIPAHAEVLARHKRLVELNDQFWKSVSDQLTKLTIDGDLDVNGTIVRVVEADANRLVIRMAGMNRRYTLADIPPGLAKFLAEQNLGTANAETHLVLGAFLLAIPEAEEDKVRDAWSMADLRGASPSMLLPLLNEDYQLANQLIEKSSVPDDNQLSDASMEFLAQWGERLEKATSHTDHAQLGQEMAAAAKSLPNGSNEQFVAYRFALAESAKGVDFATCTSIIDSWGARFEIDKEPWHLKAMQLAAGSSQSTKVFQAIAQHAIERYPKAASGSNPTVAQSILNIAQVAATKSRDKSLQDAVQALAN